jgi:hypothetical protein
MTINLSDNSPRISYTVASGVTQSSFTVPFEFFEEGDLNVYIDGTLKTITTDYTVTGGSGATGSIAMTVVGASGSSTVVITRSIPLERTTDFPTSGPFDVTSLNEELDRITAINADLNDEVSRSLRLTDADAAANLILPDLASRAGKVLAFDAVTGDLVNGPSTAGVTTVAAAAADIATLADIEDGTIATDAISDTAAIASDVTTVSGIAANVTTVAGNTSNINAVAADATDIGTVATNIANVNTAAGISANITTVAGIAADVTAAATNATDISAIAAEVAKVVTVANDLNEATSEIDVVSNNIANVNLVGTDIANVNTVASNLADINNFGDTYFVGGTAPSSPTSGDLWFDTSAQTMKVYGSSGFQNAGSSVNGTSQRVSYTATAGQTSFAATYDAGFVDLYLNGIKLISGTDFTATNGTSIVLASGAAVNDTVDIVAYGTFSVSNFSINDANDVAASGATNGQFLQYNGTNWVGGTVSAPQAGAGYFDGNNGATGDTTNGKGDIFRVHSQTLSSNVTIGSTDNALAVGPLTLGSNVTLTVNGNLTVA